MSTTFEIPLVAAPQKLTISFGGTLYQLRVVWNPAANCWIVDVLDAITQAPILTGLAMVTGLDLLEQFEYMGFGGQFIATNETDADPPNFANLGSTGHLLFITP